MLRWSYITEKEIFGMYIKAYRNPFVALKTTNSLLKNLDFDHYAYKYLGSEVFMYKFLDINFERYIEERGDLSRISNILVPIVENLDKSIF